MTEFVSTLQERVREATTALVAARAEGDDYLESIRSGELETLRRLALDHDVAVS